MDNLEMFFDDGSLIPIDLDSFLLNQIPDSSPLNVLLDATAASPSEGLWMEEIEKMLMEDEDDGLGVAPAADDVGEEVCVRFLTNMKMDSSAEGGSGSDEAAEGEAVGDADDPLSNKKLRQLRNRDSAVRSRDRKKVYMKELEMKSKYLESECLRLGWLLQCVVAENQALRSTLLYSSAYAASVIKQESAVILLGMDGALCSGRDMFGLIVLLLCQCRIPAVGFPVLVPGRHLPIQPVDPACAGRRTSSERRKESTGNASSKRSKK